MAEEDIIRLDDEDDSSDILLDELQESSLREKERLAEDKKKTKKLIIIVTLSVIIFLIIMSLIYTFLIKKPVEKSVKKNEVVQKLLKKDVMTRDKMEDMINKANYLYKNGNKIEALNMFDDISRFSEALSKYNLGVVRMKKKEYALALKTFDEAIETGDNEVFSAINAAIAALYLDRKELFYYYINLAKVFLPEIKNRLTYPFTVSLVNYYTNNAFESFVTLKNEDTGYYNKEKNHMLARAYLIYNNTYNAIKYLEKIPDPEDDFAAGLLYARVGDYNLARDKVIKYINNNHDNLKTEMALMLIYLKSGQLASASKIMNSEIVSKNNEVKASLLYPIEVKLSDSLFDVNKAQLRFMEDLKSDEKILYQILLYYASYRVFNINDTVALIKKGGINISLNQLSEAKDILTRGSRISKVDQSIISAIKDSLISGNNRKAYSTLMTAMKEFPSHPILYYNLAISSANIGKLQDAYRFFLKSYNLDSKDTLAGIYALLMGHAIGADYSRLNVSLMQDLDNYKGDNVERTTYIIAIMNFVEGNYNYLYKFNDILKTKKPEYLILKAMYALKLDEKRIFMESTKELLNISPNDILTNVLYAIATYEDLDIKSFSLKVQYLYDGSKKLNMKSLYYGASVINKIYVRLGYIVGSLKKLKDKVENTLQISGGDMRGIMQVLAYINIFTRDFEQSFTLYNTLIDELGERDSETLFYAAVAAIAAGYHSNAIALLGLTKAGDESNKESSYALGLLYQEIDNYKGAIIQYDAIGDSGFKSQFFDFKIDIAEQRRQLERQEE